MFEEKVTLAEYAELEKQHDNLAKSFRASHASLLDKVQRLTLQYDLLLEELGLELVVHPAEPEKTVVHPAKPEMLELRSIKDEALIFLGTGRDCDRPDFLKG